MVYIGAENHGIMLSDIVQSNISSTNNNSLSKVSKSILEKVHLEIIQYCSEALAEVDYKSANTLLQWWKKNSSRFSFLAKLVPKYLLIPVTSGPFEHVFSCAGHIVWQKSLPFTSKSMKTYEYN